MDENDLMKLLCSFEGDCETKQPIEGMSFFSEEGVINQSLGWLGRAKQDSMSIYSGGYSYGVTSLVGEALRSRDTLFRDTLIFPIMFMARHHLELSLKEIIYLDLLVRKDPVNYPSGHNLKALWIDCEKIFKNEDNFDKSFLENIKNPLLALNKMDKNGEVFRYMFASKNNDYKSYVKDLPDTFSYCSFVDTFIRVTNGLSQMNAYLSEKFQHMREAEENAE